MGQSFFRKAAAVLFASAAFAGTPLFAAADIDVSGGGVVRVNAETEPFTGHGEDAAAGTLSAAPAEVPAAGGSSASAPVAAPAEPPPATTAVPAEPLPEPRRAFLFESELAGFSRDDYAGAVSGLFAAYEKTTGRRLVPAAKKKVALKIFTSSGKGLATPPELTRAVRDELVRRGFARENVLIVDLGEKNLRKSGYLPPFRRGNDVWEGSPVLALDTGKFYDAKWFFENPLPSRDAYLPDASEWDAPENDRRSFLPATLMFDVDFWINLPVATDSPALGVSGALANATLWNMSNQRRFLDNPANAAVAAVSVAAIPEFRATFELTLLSLEKYQFIGGPNFYAEYVASEKRLWLSANPVILDYLLWRRMNAMRTRRGFEPILPEPPCFAMASRGAAALGSCISSEITLVGVPAKGEK